MATDLKTPQYAAFVERVDRDALPAPYANPAEHAHICGECLIRWVHNPSHFERAPDAPEAHRCPGCEGFVFTMDTIEDRAQGRSPAAPRAESVAFHEPCCFSCTTLRFIGWIENPAVCAIVNDARGEIYAIDKDGLTIERMHLGEDEPPIEPFKIKDRYAGRIAFTFRKSWRGDELRFIRLGATP